MRAQFSKVLVALSLAACGGPTQARPAAPATTTAAPHHRQGLKIGLASVYVDDQAKALRFYTEVLGFAKKTDETNGNYRWLTVASSDDLDGTQLQLAMTDEPATRALQQALFAQDKPAVMFFTDDVKASYERIKARGAEFTMPPTDVTFATIAMVKDTCGNLVQITELAR
ncbi:MAG: Glyoxalase/bleomycin resistance protein/dioxygenase [Myxococcales bacterium]|nr:Glyoxalase/bleomycin resistance protein/dioxygenase [Myxococcales bacterium]